MSGLMDGPHLPKGALPDNLDRLKVVDAESASFQSGGKELKLRISTKLKENFLNLRNSVSFVAC